MLRSVHSVVVDVCDFELAVRDHSTLLGRAPTAIDLDPVRGSRFARFRLSNIQLELRALGRGAPLEAAKAGIPFREEEGLAGLRLAGRFEPGSSLRPGRVEGLSVPIELVAESETAEPSESSAPATGTPDPDVDPAARIDGLDHVVLASSDPERTRLLLAEELGLRLALDRRFPERGLRLLFFRLGGVTLEVAAALAEPPAGAAPAAGGDALHGLAWKVPRIDALHARLRAAGFALSDIRDGHKAGTRVASLRAPFHGVPTLLIEPPPRAPAGSAA